MSIKWIDRHVVRLTAAALLGMIAVGCGPPRAFDKADAWFNPPPPVDPRLSAQLDASRINLVMPTQEQQAESMLADKPYLPLTDQQAVDLVGLPLRVVVGSARPFLVRGVYLIHNTGVFQLFRLPDGSIYVFHECLGDHTVIMQRQALVVQLDEAPKKVYAACRMMSSN